MCVQVKSEYALLRDTLGAVTRERDSALREKTQLQGKLENLEQVLKVRTQGSHATAGTPLGRTFLCMFGGLVFPVVA